MILKARPGDAVYIIGAMSVYRDEPGDKKWGRCFFEEAAKAWRAEGWRVVSPIEFDDSVGGPDAVAKEPEAKVLLRDLELIAECGAVAVLANWKMSRLGRVELMFAGCLGFPCYSAETGATFWGNAFDSPAQGGPAVEKVERAFHASDKPAGTHSQTVLEEALTLIYGARNAAYGPPERDMGRTGRMWGAILGLPDIPAETVALMMCAVKMSRQVNKPGRDNIVDLAGYAGCIEIMEKNRREK